MNTTVIFLNQCTAFISVASFDFVLLLFFSDLWPLCMVKIQSDGKESASNEGDPGSIPGLGKIPLEKEMATLSSIFAWRIPWTEEPGRLPSMELQRVR